MNVALLKKIKARILAKPDKFRMDEWSCGTAHCIAGWACVLRGDKFVKPDRGLHFVRTTKGALIWDRADALLRLDTVTVDEAFHTQHDRLLYEGNWPAEFECPPNASRERRAELAAARIDHFIATGGAE